MLNIYLYCISWVFGTIVKTLMEHSLRSYSNSIWKRIVKAWSLDFRSLSIFRIWLALVIIGDLLLRGRNLAEHYTDMGILPRIGFIDSFGGTTTWSIHSANGDLWFQIILFAIHIFLALWLLVWYRTKLSTIFIWLLTISLHNRNALINSAADDLLRNVIFWSMFLPLDRYWSWDKSRYTWTAKILCTIGTIAFISQQIFLYWVTAYLKLWPEWYGTHSAVYEILSLETFRLPFGIIIYTHPTLLRFITGASMFVEFIWPALIIFPFFNTWTRFVGIFAIILLHLGIMTNISVGVFPWIAIAAVLAFLPSAFWDSILTRWAPRGNITIYYDNHCGLCMRWIQILQNFWLFVWVKYTPLADAPKTIQALSAKNNMWVVQRGRKNTLGYDGFIELMKQSWLGRISVWILSPKISRIIGRWIYKNISRIRKSCTLPQPILPIQQKKIWTIFGAIICAVSLYSVLGMNMAVMNCQRDSSAFFRTWPLSAVNLFQERGLNFFESGKENGWVGENYTKARRPKACDIAEGTQFDLVGNHPLLKKIFTWHISIMHWWSYMPRLNQYWWMFAPDPANIDYWFVIDGELVPRDYTASVIHRDLWKDFALGDESNWYISFKKPNNLNEITVSDRWRKYVYNIMGYYSEKEYRRFFAESWCHKYNDNSESTYLLNKFTIYGMSQISRKNYLRDEVIKKPIWQHCCLKNGCFDEEKTTESR